MNFIGTEVVLVDIFFSRNSKFIILIQGSPVDFIKRIFKIVKNLCGWLHITSIILSWSGTIDEAYTPTPAKCGFENRKYFATRKTAKYLDRSIIITIYSIHILILGWVSTTGSPSLSLHR